jgi:hypothetical protein
MRLLRGVFSILGTKKETRSFGGVCICQLWVLSSTRFERRRW